MYLKTIITSNNYTRTIHGKIQNPYFNLLLKNKLYNDSPVTCHFKIIKVCDNKFPLRSLVRSKDSTSYLNIQGSQSLKGRKRTPTY